MPFLQLMLHCNGLLFMQNNFSKYYVRRIGAKKHKKSRHDSRLFVKFLVILSIIFLIKETTKIPKIPRQTERLFISGHISKPKTFFKDCVAT